MAKKRKGNPKRIDDLKFQIEMGKDAANTMKAEMLTWKYRWRRMLNVIQGRYALIRMLKKKYRYPSEPKIKPFTYKNFPPFR